MSDPAKYRSKEEVAVFKDERDPIEQLKKTLLSKKIASEEELKNIEKRIKEIVAEAVEFSSNSPEPEISELYTDIYSN
jgi:pyruvate dehydrogenase E1 component alpha subunit